MLKQFVMSRAENCTKPKAEYEAKIQEIISTDFPEREMCWVADYCQQQRVQSAKGSYDAL